MLYVAYGSNMNIEQMGYRCPRSYVVGNGRLIGWKLVFNVHADIIETCGSDTVPVVVWDIDDEDWEVLDLYEGYPTYYVKRTVLVTLDSGERSEAVVYVMADDRKGIKQPYDMYFETIKTGYEENGIGTTYLFDALEWSVANER